MLDFTYTSERIHIRVISRLHRLCSLHQNWGVGEVAEVLITVFLPFFLGFLPLFNFMLGPVIVHGLPVADVGVAGASNARDLWKGDGGGEE